eukprot:8318396-Pyramimonas_sp.AAC.1
MASAAKLAGVASPPRLKAQGGNPSSRHAPSPRAPISRAARSQGARLAANITQHADLSNEHLNVEGGCVTQNS